METVGSTTVTALVTGTGAAMIYLIGSLRNPEVPRVAQTLRSEDFEVFDDWYAAGPEADDKWRDYEKARGHSYLEGLSGLAARNVYTFDRRNLDRSQAAVLLCPAGKSGHLELGYVIGTGKPGYILLESGVERWDVMYQFATGVFENVEQLVEQLKRDFFDPGTFEASPGPGIPGTPNVAVWDPFPVI